MDRHELARAIFQVAYLTGTFKLRSGQTSNEYFDKYRFEAQPTLLREIAKAMIPLIPPGTEVLAGLEMGGIPIATALSLETGIPTAFVRKEAKEYGTCQFAEGTDVKGKKVCIIEDVVTTGGQILLSTKDLRSHGAEISDVLCAIFRGTGDASPLTEAGLRLHALFTMDELKTAGK
ncbi:MAG: orotate phosphoribosyltransferase [Bdellovibrionales bacterium]|nr:orotate phosphoribosyltransferase [Bdellovibrionales bacterium]